MSSYADLVVHSIHKRRTELAAVSALFSVFLHIGLLFWLASSPLAMSWLRPLLSTEPPREPPIHLQNVETEPAPPVTARAEADFASEGQRPLDAARDTSRLAVPADRLELEPPPPSSGRENAPPAPALAELELPAQPEAWQPRQEILAVERTQVRDSLAARERRRIPNIERVMAAADVVYPAKPQALPAAPVRSGIEGGVEKPALASILRRVTDVTPARVEPAPITDAMARSGTGVLAETGADVTQLQPIEALLMANVTTYTTRQEPDSLFFKIEIQRRSEEALPVLPKDILFVQDCSASMSEQRLYFCRQGLIDSLPLIGPQDRFNVVAFRDQVDSCFTDWTANSPEARERAATFIQGMQSRGETDVFSAIRAALNFQVQPGRPVIALLISDGYSTTGLTDGSTIIREFTAANHGLLSVFTLGTTPQAYQYLLDLLSYSNRGDARLVTRGRWDIPKEFQALTEGVRHPVLAEVGLRVAEATPCEVYPIATMNLYKDRPLVIYGRCARRQSQVVIQATGRAAAKACDMIFDLNLAGAPAETRQDLRQVWAHQKIYHLLGQYARTRDVSLLPAIDATASSYRVAVPYRDSL